MREYATLTDLDIGVVAGYFILVILIGIFATWRSNRDTASRSVSDGWNMWFMLIGASLFVSNIGMEHFIGLAGSGAASGISVGALQMKALLLLQLLGWIFMPWYIACGTYTMPEYLSRKFGGQRLRVYFAVLSLFLSILTNTSTGIYAGAVFIQQSLNWSLELSSLVLVALVTLITITGGLRAVIHTNTLQAILMAVGAIYLTGTGFQKIGGIQGLLDKYPQAVPTNVSAIVPNTTCHWPDRQAFHLIRDMDNDRMALLGFLLGQTPESIWYWCNDQVIVQRTLAAKSLSHAQGATLLAGLIKILPLFLMILLGMISRVLYPNDVACTNPDYCMEVCQSRAGCSSIAFPRLVLGLMPDGAKGLMIAVMIATLMSDLGSICYSSSTLFTMDIWRRIRKRASSTELMIVSRLFIPVMVGMSIIWVSVINETNRGQFFVFRISLSSYFAPPFAVIFFLAAQVPLVNEKGAFWSLMVALVIGATRLVLGFIYKEEGYCGQGEPQGMAAVFGNFHSNYFALLLAAITAVVAVVISYFTNRPEPKYLHKTTDWTRHDNNPPSDVEIELNATDNETTEANQNEAGDVTSETEYYAMLSTVGDEREQPFVDDTAVKRKNYEGERRSSCLYLFFKIICGTHNEADKDGEQAKRMKHHQETLSSLKQSWAQKVCLGIGLVIILGIGAAMYIFWSVYDFREGPYYPEGSEFVLPGDGRNATL